jgi:hypothetical protein
VLALDSIGSEEADEVLDELTRVADEDDEDDDDDEEERAWRMMDRRRRA